MLIFSEKIGGHHDDNRTPVSQLTEDAVRAFFKKHGHPHLYMTNLVKCAPVSSTHSIAHTRKCVEWISYERSRLKPEFVIGFGGLVKKFYKECDMYAESAARIFGNAKKMKAFEKVIKSEYKLF